MKRKSASKAERKVRAVNARIQETIDGLATSAAIQMEQKSRWVARKVRNTVERIERSIGREDALPQ